MRQSPLLPLHHPESEHRSLGDSVLTWSCADLEEEYKHLRNRAALIDHSSLGLTAVTGDNDDVESFLNHVLARDVSYLAPERSLTSLMLDDDGAPIDIVTVHRLEDGVIAESSFGNGERTGDHLRRSAEESSLDVGVLDLSEERTIVGIEGPYAWAEVGEVLDQELTALPYESVVGTEWDGDPMLFSRSGFTGEYGYKIIADHKTASGVWERLSEKVPQIGQQALEVAMLEIRQPIFYRECPVGSDLVTCGLNWLVDMNDAEFRGHDAVAATLTARPRRSTIGFRVSSSTEVKDGATLEMEGTAIGEVVFTLPSPGLGCRIGLARIDMELAASGLEFHCTSPQGESFELATLSSPYVLPGSWSVPLF